MFNLKLKKGACKIKAVNDCFKIQNGYFCTLRCNKHNRHSATHLVLNVLPWIIFVFSDTTNPLKYDLKIFQQKDFY